MELWYYYLLYSEYYDFWHIKPVDVEWIKVMFLQKLMKRGRPSGELREVRGMRERLLSSWYYIYEMHTIFTLIKMLIKNPHIFLKQI